MVSEIAEFDTVEDTLILSDTANSMPAENIIKLYMKKAIAIDKRHKKSQLRTSSARRSNTSLNVNIAESLFYVTTDSEAVDVPPSEEDIPVEALLSAFVTRTYGQDRNGGGENRNGGGGYRGRRNPRSSQPFDESTFIPRETFSTISKEGKLKWASIPKGDRARIVALFKNSPEPDSSRHPSPGQSSYVTPSRSTNNHEVHFDDENGHNPLSVLGENNEDGDDNGGVANLNMNSLRINKTLTLGSDHGDPQEPQDSPDVARALTIMNAVSSPVSSETLKRSVPNLPPGHIMRTLSTSCSVPSSRYTYPRDTSCARCLLHVVFHHLVFPLPPVEY